MNFIYHIYSYLRIIPYKGVEYIKKFVSGTPIHHTERLYDIPTRRRITNHITNLFLEPTHIIDNIYLGNAYNASNYATISKYNIAYIVNVTKEIKNYYEQDYTIVDFYENIEIKNIPTRAINVPFDTSISINDNYNNEIKYLRIPIYDDCTYHITDYIKEAMEFIDNSRDGNILVHCYMGSSRSASIVLAYLIYKYNYSLSDALLFLKDKRNIVNINVNFIDDIKKYFQLYV
jgi:protein-tyrosine phosphatase